MSEKDEITNEEIKEDTTTEDEVIKAVCADAKVEIPSGMIETETEDMLKNIENKRKKA